MHNVANLKKLIRVCVCININIHNKKKLEIYVMTEYEIYFPSNY